ncbi:MarR family transcriptional regulator [Temperatibacter marinus]|uniref:MarR family transcriptional regulator n=1 Tax=Temperatibacter marinus TaxID=1456591 RepID=A0AA52EHF7_9PROT|nr:MarR family transcriptional regulator [Temperatibacter marinus]WND02845.1 MarR family transcriptional regulator [Temperatibacter marinus]
MSEWKASLAQPSLFLREEEVRRGIELLYFAYRDFTEGADEILADMSMGRAHHRVLYFVGRNPGTNVSGLLDLLRITKQSLSRVLNQLIEEGYIEQIQGVKDRRQRLLYLTEKGIGFEQNLFKAQKDRIAQAYRAAGVEAVSGYWDVLLNIVREENREKVLKRIK